MTNAPRLSPGRFTALWIVLRSIARLGDGVAVNEVLSFARRSGLRGGGLPIGDGFKLAVLGGFVTQTDPTHLTALGRDAISRGVDEEPSSDVLRLFASALILRRPPPWVAYWQGDPASWDIVLPEPAREVLRDADLLREPTTEDLEAWAWWDALRGVPPAEETAAHRKAIGDAAEDLSLEFERNRLRVEGYPDLAERVRCIARESAAYGFDILSFCGTTHDAQAPRAALAIEVKGMALVARTLFRFYLTHHEWKTAVALGRRHIFHIWDGVHHGPDLRAHRSAPITIPIKVLDQHLPGLSDCRGNCRWETSLLTIPVPTMNG